VRWGRVLKTLWPPSLGTRRLAQQHGAPLLCVRYRDDPVGLRRFTTVELVVDIRPTPHAKRKHTARWWYPIEPAATERALHQRLRAHGARWDAEDRRWYLPAAVLQELGLLDRIAAPPHTRQRSKRPPLR
jgi:hypothetical protein